MAGSVKIVYNKLLGGWYVVTGPYHTPISGRFSSKLEAEAWLRDRQSKRNPVSAKATPVKRGKRKTRKTKITRARKNPTKRVDHYIDGASDARRGLPPQSRHVDYMLGYNAAKLNMSRARKNPTAKFDKTYCSQCGGEFGPGNSGFSSCTAHRKLFGRTVKRRKQTPARKKSYLERRAERQKTNIARRNPYEAFVIVGYFWHKAETKFYWTGVNWTNRKSSASQYRYSAEAWREAKQYRKSWASIYPQLRHVKVERL